MLITREELIDKTADFLSVLLDREIDTDGNDNFYEIVNLLEENIEAGV